MRPVTFLDGARPVKDPVEPLKRFTPGLSAVTGPIGRRTGNFAFQWNRVFAR
jgi:hypothetical protein